MSCSQQNNMITMLSGYVPLGVNREMNNILGEIIKKSTFLLLTIFLTTSCSFANIVNLSEIEITPHEQKNYQINIKTDNTVNFKQQAKNNTLTINLPNTKITKDFTTNYKNVSGINNVMITPKGYKNLTIQIQGENITNSEVNIETPKTILPKIQKEFITTTSLKTDKPANSSNFNWISILGLAIIIITAKKSLSKITKNNLKTTFVKNSLEKEKEYARDMTLKTRKTLLLRNKIKSNNTTITPSIHYTTSKLHKQHLHNLTSIPIKSKHAVTPHLQITGQEKQLNINSMKFLQSMIKIYEHNGNQDLASDLKNKITKVYT